MITCVGAALSLYNQRRWHDKKKQRQKAVTKRKHDDSLRIIIITTTTSAVKYHFWLKGIVVTKIIIQRIGQGLIINVHDPRKIPK